MRREHPIFVAAGAVANDVGFRMRWLDGEKRTKQEAAAVRARIDQAAERIRPGEVRHHVGALANNQTLYAEIRGVRPNDTSNNRGAYVAVAGTATATMDPMGAWQIVRHVHEVHADLEHYFEGGAMRFRQGFRLEHYEGPETMARDKALSVLVEHGRGGTWDDAEVEDAARHSRPRAPPRAAVAKQPARQPPGRGRRRRRRSVEVDSFLSLDRSEWRLLWGGLVALAGIGLLVVGVKALVTASEWLSAAIGWPVVGWALFAIVLVLAVVWVAYVVTGEFQRKRRIQRRRERSARDGVS